MSQSHKLSSSGEFSIINCYLARKCNILNLILKKPIKFNFHNEAINNEIQCYCYGHLLSFKKVRNFQSGKKLPRVPLETDNQLRNQIKLLR